MDRASQYTYLGMAWQRNSSKFVRLFFIISGVCALVFLLYDCKQAHSEVHSKTRSLKVAEDEYVSLSKRFDILSSELKGECLKLPGNLNG